MSVETQIPTACLDGLFEVSGPVDPAVAAKKKKKKKCKAKSTSLDRPGEVEDPLFEGSEFFKVVASKDVGRRAVAKAAPGLIQGARNHKRPKRDCCLFLGTFCMCACMLHEVPLTTDPLPPPFPPSTQTNQSAGALVLEEKPYAFVITASHALNHCAR